MVTALNNARSSMGKSLDEQVYEIEELEGRIGVLQRERRFSDDSKTRDLEVAIWSLIDELSVLCRPQLIKDLYNEVVRLREDIETLEAEKLNSFNYQA